MFFTNSVNCIEFILVKNTFYHPQYPVFLKFFCVNIKFWQNFKGQAELANLTVTVASLSQLKQIHRAALCWTNSILFVKANWPTRAPQWMHTPRFDWRRLCNNSTSACYQPWQGCQGRVSLSRNGMAVQ